MVCVIEKKLGPLPSHLLSSIEEKWSVIEKEAYILQKLHWYLDGSEFVMKTDYKPLQYLFKAEQTNKIQQWALKLRGYNCYIEYYQVKKTPVQTNCEFQENWNKKH